ncbi:hypothetical protein [Rickettsia fournieri]|uniref:hypothetical protein n=1 Tax=Rickettsia fournieri TaxID=1436798 RepID=UPI000CDEAE6A|nr:hypothetical protein [Rickettsia fournieri]
MKSQNQKFQDYRNYNTQESNLNAKAEEEILNQDNRICYKKRREELNQRVKSVLEQKKQVASSKYKKLN